MKAKAKAKASGEQIFANVGWWIILDELIKKQAFNGQHGGYIACREADFEEVVRVLSL
jgi:hypothetical protein